MSVAAEAVNREHSSQAEAKEFARSELVFCGVILQVVVWILQIFRNIENPDPISDLELPPMARGAALASSPTSHSLCCFHQFLSTSTYSASITPSSCFFPASPLPPGSGPPALAPVLPPGGGVCACADLYICSASLCEAWVRVSRARSICALSFDSSAFFASAIAFSTSPRSEPEILSPCSFSIFSIW